jgi:hypothetical protein
MKDIQEERVREKEKSSKGSTRAWKRRPCGGAECGTQAGRSGAGSHDGDGKQSRSPSIVKQMIQLQ